MKVTATKEKKQKQTKTKAVANNVSQQKNNSRDDSGFVDNRPETKALKSLQMMINDSPRMAAQRQRISNITGGTAQVIKGPIKGPDTNIPTRKISKNVVQRIIIFEDGPNIDQPEDLVQIASEFTPDKFTEKYREATLLFLRRIFDNDKSFKSKMKLLLYVGDYLEEMERQIEDLGVRREEMDAFYKMYNDLGNANPEHDEVVLHKLHYPNMKKQWVETYGGGEEETHRKGTVYNPIVGGDLRHTMPLNFSWIVAVAHHGLPICITTPLTERVLVRPRTSEGATNMENVRAGIEEAPISATAREILALLRTGYYRLSIYDMDEGEIILLPTGKGRDAWPKDVEIPRKMMLSALEDELGSYGIYIVEERVAIEKENALKIMQEEQRRKAIREAGVMTFKF